MKCDSMTELSLAKQTAAQVLRNVARNAPPSFEAQQLIMAAKALEREVGKSADNPAS